MLMFIRIQALIGAFFTTMLGMRLITQQAAAELIGVTDRSIRNMISRGVITGYKIPGVRAVRVDRDEIMGKLRAIPTAVARQEFVHGPAKFNGNVKTAPVGASVVAEVVSE